MAYNKKAHLLTNIEAIRIAFALDREKREATESERAILKQYSGFGGIKCILNPAQSEADKARWTQSDSSLFPLVADLHQLIRENSKNEQEYKNYFDSLKKSILTAFYTPPEIVQTLSDTLKGNGITPVRFLEPSAGNGVYVDAFKQTFPNTETVCFEKDFLTGKILSHLNPDDKVHIGGFEEIEDHPDNRFDVVSSNIPFGDISVFDASFMKSDSVKRNATRAVHNYFFLKSVDIMREGGIVAFITSQGVMNSPSNEPVREWLMKNTNLVSAVRLPNNLMSDNAGTEVGSDLIILQKNSGKTSLSPDETLFLKSRTLSNGANINNYYQDFSRVVHTKGFPDKDLYGKPGMTFLHEGGVSGMAADLGKMLSKDFYIRLDKNLYADNRREPKYQPTKEEKKFDVFENHIEREYSELKQNSKEPEKQNNPVIQEPLMSLYDLFGFSEEERKQHNKTKKGKKKPKPQGKPVQQLNLFSQQVTSTTQKSQTLAIQSEKDMPHPRPAYSLFDEQKEESQKRKPEEQMSQSQEPRPYSGGLLEHHKQGSLVLERNGQYGFLQRRYRDDAEFKSLELNPLQKQKALQYIKLRDTYHLLYNYEVKERKENRG